MSQSLPFHFASSNGVLLEEREGHSHLMMRDDAPYHALLELQRHLTPDFTVEALNPESFQSKLYQHYEDPNRRLPAIDTAAENADWRTAVAQTQGATDLIEQESDGPAVKLVNSLLIEAIRGGASDIHIETYERQMSVRLRIDGDLKEILAPDASLAPMLISRIKVMARLDIAEKRMPQDGRLSLRLAGREIDLRVSTIPVSDGERVVLRLLDKQAGILDLACIGMNHNQLETLNHLIHRPHGMMLVTGPTGSGKTTTLYAALSGLNDKKRNILAIEDPVEYRLKGVGQTQVNSKTGLTFASGLRALLRQDPDVIMVGEIRDRETAQIAIQAALTGHMVLSTLHTSSALGAVTRLRDMGIESFLLASCLIGVHAQRLVRKLCPDCREFRPTSAGEAAFLGDEGANIAVTAHAKGCINCGGLGYRGRMAIHEVIPIDSTLQRMIHDEAPEHVLATTRHTASLHSIGVRHVRDGTTSAEELVRVTEA